MRPIIRLDRRVTSDEILRDARLLRSCSEDNSTTGEVAARRLTDEEAYLVGREPDFLGAFGQQIYKRVAANRGSQLRRVGATESCVVCGMPALPGVAAFAHIHMRDLHLSPHLDPTRVFCLCWHHHHGCYDQGYISTIERLWAEAIWIGNKRRPKPHGRDIAFMKRVNDGGLIRHCIWNERRVERRATFDPISLTRLVQRPSLL